jgi:hypothetical protein
LGDLTRLSVLLLQGNKIEWIPPHLCALIIQFNSLNSLLGQCARLAHPHSALKLTGNPLNAMVTELLKQGIAMLLSGIQKYVHLILDLINFLVRITIINTIKPIINFPNSNKFNATDRRVSEQAEYPSKQGIRKIKDLFSHLMRNFETEIHVGNRLGESAQRQNIDSWRHISLNRFFRQSSTHFYQHGRPFVLQALCTISGILSVEIV